MLDPIYVEAEEVAHSDRCPKEATGVFGILEDYLVDRGS